jgi:hypothetical protein
MTERTIRSMAKELAGIFYEENRSEGFRKTFPTLRAYMRGQWHQSNGEIVINKPGWMYHLDLARAMLLKMLSLPDSQVTPLMKERIYDAWLEEHDASKKQQAKKVLQRKIELQ